MERNYIVEQDKDSLILSFQDALTRNTFLDHIQNNEMLKKDGYLSAYLVFKLLGNTDINPYEGNLCWMEDELKNARRGKDITGDHYPYWIILPHAHTVNLPLDKTKKNIPGIDDGGERIRYGENGAFREPADGKGRFDLITPFGLQRLARWYELGAKKYADRNWERGIPFSRYMDSAMRHLTKYMMGMTDEDHLAAAAWNILCIIHHEECGQKELDDLPHYYQKKLSENLDEMHEHPIQTEEK